MKKKLIQEDEELGTLRTGEPHPAVDSAKAYLKSIPYADLCMWLSALSSTAIEGNRLAEICTETLDRLLRGKPVSDRYLLGLLWTIAAPTYKGIDPPTYKGALHDKKNRNRD